VALTSADAKRLSASLTQLLSSEALTDPDRWRMAAGQALCQLVARTGRASRSSRQRRAFRGSASMRT
jgi:hypothetical protein